MLHALKPIDKKEEGSFPWKRVCMYVGVVSEVPRVTPSATHLAGLRTAVILQYPT